MNLTRTSVPRAVHARLNWWRVAAPANRRGAAMVEGAIVMGVFLTIIFGMLDLGLAVARYNMISHAARQATREAIVRGSLAPPRRAAWGPGTFTGTAASQNEIAQVVQRSLPGIDPDTVNIVASWPDGGNTELMRVRVVVTVNYQPIMVNIFTNQTIPLTASSTMRIAY